jgi:hypothetical protein
MNIRIMYALCTYIILYACILIWRYVCMYLCAHLLYIYIIHIWSYILDIGSQEDYTSICCTYYGRLLMASWMSLVTQPDSANSADLSCSWFLRSSIGADLHSWTVGKEWRDLFKPSGMGACSLSWKLMLCTSLHISMHHCPALSVFVYMPITQ